MNEKPLRIDQMYAFVAVDDDGNEGVAGISTPKQEQRSPSFLKELQELCNKHNEPMPTDMESLPLVGADMARVQDLTPIAQMICNQTGKPIRLITFDNRTELTAFSPMITGAKVETSGNN